MDSNRPTDGADAAADAAADAGSGAGAGANSGEQHGQRSSSRRNFLKFAGFGAAGVAASAAAAFGISALGRPAGEAPAPVPTPTGSLPPRADGPGFDHLVVVMYENRSFDNILGYLYADGGLPAGQSFDGLTSEHSNTTAKGHTVAVHRYTGNTDVIMSSPRPDPGEEFPHVNTQLFGTVSPEDNRHKKVLHMTAPFNAPSDASSPSMTGFLQDYINNYVADHQGEEPTEDEYSVVMGAFDPQMLPVFSTLAKNFAVYDSWHCAVPSQTFGNRSFFHASTSHGYVTNSGDGGYKKWFDEKNAAATVFNRLSDAGIDWAVYYDEKQIVSMTGFIHAPAIEQYFTTNFRTMSQFYDDVAKGALPAYSFVEPRMVYDHNDMHPPVGPLTETDVDGTIVSGGAVSDVRAGEALLHQIYSAVRASGSTSGSNAMNTMLLVTFDEHGGIYDHVPPPAATPPGDGAPGEMGFTFDRLGVRVPAIAISAYTAKNSVIHDPMHHGSVISTLTTKYGLPPLTARDSGAPTIDNATNLTTPRDPSSWPQTSPQYVPANPESGLPFDAASEERPLSPPGVGLVGMLIAKYGKPGDVVPTTYQQAYELLTKRGQDIFGSS
ncbi:alkaline phosphatase family protein [Herbiconiux sp. L3-i23]|uniref:alkaline phosphatase family protein n=1 Tax=Herbiconiux sp. L3-i23 TaxID=2905871 RepID=UPI0020632E5F|nr:alkaline phosphatase family protein [Herbiconiux sp. L3-i23]BDI21944.1 phosphoesterase [Herbiconiux sp. L3-i23]